MADLFRAAGSIRRDYDAVDWAASPLGDVASWSPALCNAVDLALSTRFPVTLLWGPEHVLVYNAAYVELIAGKHPGALGRPAREVFPEAWSVIGPMLAAVRATGEPTWSEDILLPLHRRGFLENCWFTFSYSPVRGPDGEVEGVLDIATETTSRVVLGRRLQLLTRLGEALAPATGVEDVVERAVAVLRAAPTDLAGAEIGRVRGTSGRRVRVEHGPDGTWVWQPLVNGTTYGASFLGVRLHPHLPEDADYLGFVALLGGAVDQALDRVAALEAERSFSEALQRSLLSRPPTVPGLEVAVRYQAALEVAQVGGDWYDAFELRDGSLTVVVGDVAGHDENAAAAMAQLRNLTRGVAVTRWSEPATMLGDLDRAVLGLGLDVVATAVLGQVRPIEGSAGRLLEWSSAGHPPPVLIEPDGTARVLERAPDLLLGLDPTAERGSHSVVLEPGSTVLLYSDGLIERRGVPLDESVRWLVSELDDRRFLDAEAVCDHLLGEVGLLVDDDIVLLALRVTG
ncbi:SpoIIE family protein phosphatase [Nocardioides pantholopis]|uniref:SpoIIE family protein phosphatase n=1 Tax=Nocardioides pantholopis TaxID=2483798 RepID=UPI000FD7ACCB|nr:SpoIIE family protein phosphatase [Nocardioides pantholopis]